MARRTARLLSNPALLDTLRLGETISLVEVAPSAEIAGQTLADLHLRQTHQVTVVAIRDTLRDEIHINPDPHTSIMDSDVLVVIGKDEGVARFARRK